MKVFLVVRKSHKTGSQVIRWATNEPFSHIGVSFDNCDTVYHSDSRGCRLESAWDFAVNSHAEVSTFFTPSFEEFTGMMWRARSKVGSKYDFLGVLGFGALLLLKKIGIKSKMPVFNPSWMFCSEYSEYIIFGTNTTLTPMQVVEKVKQKWLV